MTSTQQATSTLTPGASPSALVSISAAADGSVWAADSSGALYACGTAPTGWMPVAGTMNAVAAASDGTVLGLSAIDGSLVALNGTAWVPVSPPAPGALSQIAVGSAQWAVGIEQASGMPVAFDGTAWTALPGPAATQVSAASDGSAWALAGGVVSALVDGAWSANAGDTAMSWISGGESGWLFALDADGTPFQWDGGWQAMTPAPPAPLAQIAAGDDTTIVALDRSGALWTYDDTWNSLEAAEGIVSLSAGSATAVWAVAAGSAVFHYGTDATWEQQPGVTGVTCVAAISATDVWYLVGQTIFHSQGGQVPGGLSQISAGSDGTVWGVESGNVYQYGDGTWTQVAGTLAAVAVGAADLVFGLDDSGNVLQFGAGAWTALPGFGAPATDLAAGSDGCVLATDGDGNLWLYLGAWTQVTTGIAKVTAGDIYSIWAITSAGTALALTNGQDSWGEGAIQPIAAPGTRVPRWDTEDPFNEVESTHLWIVNRAAQLAGAQGGAVGQALAALVQPYVYKIGDNGFHDNLCQGLYDADFKAPYNDPHYKVTTYASHFYNPTTGKNWLGETDPTALTRGRSFAARALDYYYAGNMAGAGYALGLALHYFTDMTQPMHAGNYTYLSSMPFGWHTSFEQRVMEMMVTLAPPTTLSPNAGNDLDSYYINAAQTSLGYLSKVVPANSLFDMWGQAEPYVPTILSLAITETAQFLVAWMRLAQQSAATQCEIVCAGSGLVVDGTFPLGPLAQRSLNGASTQQWIFSPLPAPDAGSYRVATLNKSGFVIEVAGNSTKAGAYVQPNKWDNGSNQKWRLVDAGGGQFRLQNQNSQLYMTVSNLAKNGSSLVQQPLDSGSDQEWILAPLDTTVISCSQDTNLVLDVPHKSNSSGKFLQLYPLNGGRNQLWQFVPALQEGDSDERELYVIMSLQSGLALGCVPVTGGVQQVAQLTWNGSAGQQWERVEEDSGLSVFYNQGISGGVLLATMAGQGGSLVVQADTGSALARWSLSNN